MLEKARRKMWTLRHVKKAGMGESDLLKIFNSIIRPTLEYAVPTFHPMLTAELSDMIEAIQKRACKIIYGWDSDYDVLVEGGMIETLQNRRERLTKNFAVKAAASTRFAHWFKEKKKSEHNLRKEDRYEEYFARTDRMKNSPLYFMRRMLNNI